MESNIILAGVGGQGILSIAYVVDNAALLEGFNFKQAEVHGMAQRGGAVQSNLRIADSVIHSDLIPLGGVNLILSVEPLEALRYCHYLRPDGKVVTSSTPYKNISDYPELETLYSQLEALPSLVMINSERLAKAAGSVRAQNTVMIGAAAPYLPLKRESLERYIVEMFLAKGEKIVELNRKAFKLGIAFGEFYRRGQDAGISRRLLRLFLEKVAPDSLDPNAIAAWATVLKGEHAGSLALALEGLTQDFAGTAEKAEAVLAAPAEAEAIRAVLQA